MKEQIKIFFTALMFYTRIPCPKDIDHSPAYINKATRYFPLIGWIVGGISFVTYVLGAYLWDNSLAVVFALLAGVLTTGAFHEDGLADVFDGFGGGWTKTKILDIMKDSRLGTYGVIALIFLFLCKFLALDSLLTGIEPTDYGLLFLVFVTYHALARWTAINIVFTSHYSREDATSKAKPIAKTHGKAEIIGAYLCGLFPLLALCWWHPLCAAVLVPLFFLYFFSKRYFERWIDGYTGDCLGAVEQLAEGVCLLTFVSLWKFM
ncbi:MAG: adenosylcobinamide-GDP ribazoletransferase [Bacteroidota bacterium]